jgi:hypothetical protein
VKKEKQKAKKPACPAGKKSGNLHSRLFGFMGTYAQPAGFGCGSPIFFLIIFGPRTKNGAADALVGGPANRAVILLFGTSPLRAALPHPR